MHWSKILLRVIVVIAVGGAAFLLYRTLSQFTMDDVVSSVGSIPLVSFLAALGFAAGSYLCLTGFDWLAVRYAGKPLAWRRTALASFVSLSIGHNVGVAALSSGAIRYRFYSRWGLSAGEVAKVIVFSGLTVGLGLSTLGGLGLLLYPSEAQSLVGLGRHGLIGIAVTCLCVPVVYLLLAAFVRKELKFGKWSLDLPVLPIAAAQVGVGVLNFAFVAACLHQLLSAFAELPYLEVAAIYVIGNVTALISHVPGGLGVLEATILFLLSGTSAIGALIAFRVAYFFIPLAIGLPLFAVSEYVLRGSKGDAAATASPSRQKNSDAMRLRAS